MTATKQAVDFTNVKEMNFVPRRVPAGEYRAKITKVEDHTSQSNKTGKADNWVFTIVLNAHSRNTYPYYCGFDEKQAWKIRNLCIAVGIAVPKKRIMVDPNKLVGKELGVLMDDDEYEGKLKSAVQAVFPTDELSSDAPASSGRGGSKEVDDEIDDADEVGDDDDLELDEI